MLNAKSLGVEKQIPLNHDMEYSPMEIEINEDTAFSSTSGAGLVQANKYHCSISGYVICKEKSIQAYSTVLGQMPVKPKIANAYIEASIASNKFLLYINAAGNLMSTTNLELSANQYMHLVGDFPISTGGGLLNRVISFLRSHRLGVLGC